MLTAGESGPVDETGTTGTSGDETRTSGTIGDETGTTGDETRTSGTTGDETGDWQLVCKWEQAVNQKHMMDFSKKQVQATLDLDARMVCMKENRLTDPCHDCQVRPGIWKKADTTAWIRMTV